MFTDSNTGQVLFVDGHQGKMWSGVIGDNHLTEHRGYEGKGKALSSAAERVMPGAGRWVGYGQDGIKEVSDVADSIMKLKGGKSAKGGGTIKTGAEYNNDVAEYEKYFERLGYKILKP